MPAGYLGADTDPLITIGTQMKIVSYRLGIQHFDVPMASFTIVDC